MALPSFHLLHGHCGPCHWTLDHEQRPPAVLGQLEALLMLRVLLQLLEPVLLQLLEPGSLILR